MEMPTGSLVLSALLEQGVTHVCTVPDWIQIDLHRAILADQSHSVRLLTFCSEDEAITTAAGLIAGGAHPVVVIQNQGLYAGLNALRAVGLDAGLPIVMLIGQFGREIENYTPDPQDSTRRVVRILEPILRAIDVEFWRIDSVDDLSCISAAFQRSRSSEKPTAVIFGRNLQLEVAA